MRKFIGILLAAFGSLILAFAAMTLIDPSGSQMADDTNPFGMPPSGLRSFTAGLFGFAAAFAGWKLVYRKNEK
jgi:hypothetical protein